MAEVENCVVKTSFDLNDKKVEVLYGEKTAGSKFSSSNSKGEGPPKGAPVIISYVNGGQSWRFRTPDKRLPEGSIWGYNI